MTVTHCAVNKYRNRWYPQCSLHSPRPSMLCLTNRLQFLVMAMLRIKKESIHTLFFLLYSHL